MFPTGAAAPGSEPRRAAQLPSRECSHLFFPTAPNKQLVVTGDCSSSFSFHHSYLPLPYCPLLLLLLPFLLLFLLVVVHNLSSSPWFPAVVGGHVHSTVLLRLEALNLKVSLRCRPITVWEQQLVLRGVTSARTLTVFPSPAMNGR